MNNRPSLTIANLAIDTSSDLTFERKHHGT